MLGGTAGSIERLALAVDREGKPRAIIIREPEAHLARRGLGARIRGTHRWLAPASHGRRGCKDSASGHRGSVWQASCSFASPMSSARSCLSLVSR